MVNNKRTHHIRLQCKNGVWVHRYYDVKTGLISRSTRPDRASDNNAQLTIDFYDFKPQGKYGDHLLSTRQVVVENGTTLEYKLEHYEFDMQMPEYVFDVPDRMRDAVEAVEKKRKAQAKQLEQRRQQQVARNNRD